MLVFLIVGLKFMLVTSHAASWWVTVSMPMRQTDGRTPDHFIMLSTGPGQRNTFLFVCLFIRYLSVCLLSSLHFVLWHCWLNGRRCIWPVRNLI